MRTLWDRYKKIKINFAVWCGCFCVMTTNSTSANSEWNIFNLNRYLEAKGFDIHEPVPNYKKSLARSSWIFCQLSFGFLGETCQKEKLTKKIMSKKFLVKKLSNLYRWRCALSSNEERSNFHFRTCYVAPDRGMGTKFFWFFKCLFQLFKQQWLFFRPFFFWKILTLNVGFSGKRYQEPNPGPLNLNPFLSNKRPPRPVCR